MNQGRTLWESLEAICINVRSSISERTCASMVSCMTKPRASRPCTRPNTATPPRAMAKKWLAAIAPHERMFNPLLLASVSNSLSDLRILAASISGAGVRTRDRTFSRRASCAARAAEHDGQERRCVSTAADVAGCNSPSWNASSSSRVSSHFIAAPSILVLDEQRLQLHPCSRQARHHRPDRNAHDFRNLLVRQILKLSQHHDLTQVLRQLLQCGLHIRALDLGQQLGVGS